MTWVFVSGPNKLRYIIVLQPRLVVCVDVTVVNVS